MTSGRNRDFGHIRKRTLQSGLVRYQASFMSPMTSRRVTKSFTYKRDANRFLAEQHALILNGEWHPIDEQEKYAPQKSSSPLFGTVADKWLEHKKENVCESSVKTYQSQLRPVRRYLKTYRLSRLDTAALNRLLSRFRHDMKPGAARNSSQVLRYVLVWAAKRGIYDDGQLVNVDWIPYRQQRSPLERRIATIDEIRIMYEAMPDYLKATVLLAVYCALRKGKSDEFIGLFTANAPESPFIPSAHNCLHPVGKIIRLQGIGRNHVKWLGRLISGSPILATRDTLFVQQGTQVGLTARH